MSDSAQNRDDAGRWDVDVARVAEVASQAAASAVAHVLETRRRQDAERAYGYKAIALLISSITGDSMPDEKTIRRWVKVLRFPMDKDPQGLSVKRVNLERWLEATRKAVKD